MTKMLPHVRTAMQINMHPFDARYVVHTLPHQLRVWANQVDRICLTLDTSVAKAGRYHAGQFEEAQAEMRAILERVTAPFDHVFIDEVDYDSQARDQIKQTFFSQTPNWPDRAFDGGPFRVYFHGIMRANADFVLHMDSDMLFGGGSNSWIEEAIALFAEQEDALFVCPFSGPPLPDGKICNDQHMIFADQYGLDVPKPIASEGLGYSFNTVSTRIFMIDMQRFAQRVGSLSLVKPSLRQRLRAYALAENPNSVAAEEVLSVNMVKKKLSRIDWLGQKDGMYSLHPPYRTAAFYNGLPDLIDRAEKGDVPDAQRGDCDVNNSMIDWSGALQSRRGFARWRKGLKQLIAVQVWRVRSIFGLKADAHR